jgi:phage-related protein
MAFTIDFGNITDPGSLADGADTFVNEAKTELETLEEKMLSLTSTVASNCDIFGSLNELISDANAAFKDAVKETSRKFQAATSELMKSVGILIKGMKTKIGEIKKTVDKIKGQVESKFDSVRDFLSGVQQTFSDIGQSIIDSIDLIKDTASKLMQDFATGIKSVLAKGCAIATDAIKSIGKGGGIDSFVDGVAGNVEGAMTSTKKSLENATDDVIKSVNATLKLINPTFDSFKTSFA